MWLGQWIALAVFVTVLCLLSVLQHTAVRDLTAQRERARAALIETEEVSRTIELQIEQGLSLERLSILARSRLGMVDPSVVHYVRLNNAGRR